MPDILLFGATGYTGRLTAEALARRGASFAIAGRNKSKLYALADDTGGPEVRVAEVGDVEGLTAALEDVKVLITTVGPFLELGDTAVEAALRAKVHYIDSTGEGPFIAKLITQRDAPAREAGIVMAPAMGFDEVPADVAATMSSEGIDDAEVILTYAVPTVPSKGTIRSSLAIVTSPGPWIENRKTRMMRAGEEQRWAPMPPPLGPKPSLAFPLAEGHLAPLHLDLRALKLFITASGVQRYGIRFGLGALERALDTGWGQWMLEKALARLPEGPSEETRRKSRWTILAEASSGRQWKNVALMGNDVYGLTGELLAAGAMKMCESDYDRVGVCAPVQAIGLDVLQKELIDRGVSIDTYESR
ncbi:MAG: saccharopine dehydrogenase NADP-binding domain-containing protein [Actinomycetota bacterium]|nr:saccharopine dehydrogenase NADP-binding domain-containing protein [Actinomycetota bacterium]